MKFLLIVVLFLLSSGIAQAQEKIPGVGHRPLVGNSVADKKFWAVSTALIGSTIYDVESTYFSIGKGYRELNPRMRSFVNAGRPGLYMVQGSVDAGVIFLSYKMKKADSKLWWIVPIAVTAWRSVSGTHNMRIAIRF